jgi:Na+/melibiose symporter-like transporter
MRSVLTLRQTLLYSCTSIGINLINTSVSTWLLYYYAPPPSTGNAHALVFCLLGPFLGGYFVLIYAMMGAGVEQDAALTRQRREAIHHSVFSFSVGMRLLQTSVSGTKIVK